MKPIKNNTAVPLTFKCLSFGHCDDCMDAGGRVTQEQLPSDSAAILLANTSNNKDCRAIARNDKLISTSYPRIKYPRLQLICQKSTHLSHTLTGQQ